MLLLCKARKSPKCQRVRSAHNRSAYTFDCICPACQDWLQRHQQPVTTKSDLDTLLHKERKDVETDAKYAKRSP